MKQNIFSLQFGGAMQMIYLFYWNITQKDFIAFLSEVNATEEWINFTLEIEGNKIFAFLYILINNTENTFETKVHRKITQIFQK